MQVTVPGQIKILKGNITIKCTYVAAWPYDRTICNLSL